MHQFCVYSRNSPAFEFSGEPALLFLGVLVTMSKYSRRGAEHSAHLYKRIGERTRPLTISSGTFHRAVFSSARYRNPSSGALGHVESREQICALQSRQRSSITVNFNEKSRLQKFFV